MSGTDTKMVLVGDKRYKPDTVRGMMFEYRAAMDDTFVDAGKALLVIMEHHLHSQWGYSTFVEYVDKELGWKQQKASYLMRVAKFYARILSIPDEAIVKIGVAKANAMIPVIKRDKESCKKWFGMANKLSLSDLQKEVVGEIRKAITDKSASKSGGAGVPDSIETLTRFSVGLYDAQWDTVNSAVEVAEKMCQDAGKPSDSKGYFLEMICLSFLADNPLTTKEVMRKVARGVARVLDKKVKFEDA